MCTLLIILSDEHFLRWVEKPLDEPEDSDGPADDAAEVAQEIEHTLSPLLRL